MSVLLRLTSGLHCSAILTIQACLFHHSLDRQHSGATSNAAVNVSRACGSSAVGKARLGWGTVHPCTIVCKMSYKLQQKFHIPKKLIDFDFDWL